MKVAWIFPGQGSQEVGMGADLAERFPAARAVFERADAALGERLSELAFRGPLEDLTLTKNTQPALLATSTALLAAAREAWPELPAPVVALGHSLGEYSALTSSGALSLEDGVRICRARGLAMQAAVPEGEGSMAAVLGVDAAALEAVCAESGDAGVVAPANFNAPGQIVIAGAKAAVDKASALLQQRGGKVIPLRVSAPFHCALMKPAAEALSRELEGISIGAMRFPVIANVDAEPNDDPSRVKSLLVRQVDAPVQWVKSIERAAALGVTTMLEIGPGKVLAGLVKRISKSIRVVNVSDATSVEALRKNLEA
ncbi:MAG: ACP S-malonyltransferase [Polyangiaceae bacterium]